MQKQHTLIVSFRLIMRLKADLLDLASNLKVEADRVEKLQVSSIALRRGIDTVEANKLDKNILNDAVEPLKPRLLDLEEELADLSKRFAAEVIPTTRPRPEN
eukprot:681878-Amphidinium_carterae.1